MRPRDRYAPSPRVKFSAHTNSSSPSVVFSSRFLPRVVSRVVGFVFFVCVSRTPSSSRLARFLVVLPRSAPPSFVDASPPRLVRSIRALLLPPFPRVARVAIVRRAGIPSTLSSFHPMPLARARFQTNERTNETLKSRTRTSARTTAKPRLSAALRDDLKILSSIDADATVVLRRSARRSAVEPIHPSIHPSIHPAERELFGETQKFRGFEFESILRIMTRQNT